DGAAATYLYQYAPEPLQRTTRVCATWGSYGMFAGTQNYMVRQRTAQFFAAQMLTQQWAQPVDAQQALFGSIQATFGGNAGLLGAYTLLRSDGQYAVLLVNRDPARSLAIDIAFR